jgi:hypothetical protein
MIHKTNITANPTDSTVIAVAGHNGFIGQIVSKKLTEARIEFHRIPGFRELTTEEINDSVPPGKILLINCTGKTPKLDSVLNNNVFIDNTESLKNLVNAFAGRLASILQMSTSHLDSLEIRTDYARSKESAERYLKEISEENGVEGIILRLPTIWSTTNLKDESLLSDLKDTDIQNLNGLIRDSTGIVKIAPERSLGIEVIKFLNRDIKNLGFDSVNSWEGTVGELIEHLGTNRSPKYSVLEELKNIYDHWRTLAVNS